MKLFQKGELKLLWPFYLDALISPMLFFMPAFLIVYLRDLGFSLFQIGILVAVMPLFILIFEIPTGAIADIYGRKFSVLLGLLLEGIGVFLAFFFTNFYALMAVFAFIGIGTTFSSGASEAWIVDLLKKKKKNFLQKYFVKKQSFDSFALVVSGILGAFLVKHFGISIIWIAGGLSFLVSILMLMFAEEYFVRKKVKIRDSFRETNKKSIESLRYSKGHPVLFYFFISAMILFFAGSFSGNLSWIPFLQELGFPDYAFGYLWSAMGFVGIFAPFIAHRLLKKGKEKGFILMMIILGILILLPVLFVYQLYAAIFILVASIFLLQMSRPAERIFFQRFIPSKLRATIGSVEGALMSAVGILAVPLTGLSLDLIGTRYTFLLSAVLMIPAAIVFAKIREKKN
jgi:MFS family permease